LIEVFPTLELRNAYLDPKRHTDDQLDEYFEKKNNELSE